MAGRPTLPPERGLQSPAREDRPVGCQVAQHDAFAIGGEDHVMLADDITAPDRREPDIAALAGTGDAVAPAVLHVAQIQPAPARRGLSQHQRGAGGRVDLVAVMRFDHFDVEIRVQSGGHLLGQSHQQVHPEAHVARTHDAGVVGAGVQYFDIGVGQARGADHVHGAGLCRQFRVSDSGFGRGEIDHCLRLDDGLQRIVHDRHARRGAAHRFAEISAHPIVARAFCYRDKMRAIRGVHRLDQHLPHAARGPHHGNADAAL
mmetsp:Transcript_7003/g.12229  ORF Transcript_7003/g.12229 Transcript_7003/m.12229 type:complete len:260 (-) Transcript_7003:16-795(-)